MDPRIPALVYVGDWVLPKGPEVNLATQKRTESNEVCRHNSERTWIARRHPLCRLPPHPRTNGRNDDEKHGPDAAHDEREKDDGFFVCEMTLSVSKRRGE
jgi:hypothetical protein